MIDIEGMREMFELHASMGFDRDWGQGVDLMALDGHNIAISSVISLIALTSKFNRIMEGFTVSLFDDGFMVFVIELTEVVQGIDRGFIGIVGFENFSEELIGKSFIDELSRR